MSVASRLAPSHRWRILAIGVAANASFAAALAGIPTTAVFMRSGYALGTGDLGFVLSAMGLGVAVSEVPWGLATDRLGDRKVLLSGLGLTGVVLALMALFVSPAKSYVPPTTLLGLGLLLVGAIGGSLNGSSGRAVMAWFEDSERGFAMSVRQMATAGQGPLTNRELWRMVCALGALCIPQIATVTFAAVFLHDVAHLGTPAISASIVAFQIDAALARVWSGRFTDRHKNRRPFLKACALLTAAIFASLGLLVGLGSASPGHAASAIAAAVVLLVLGGTVSQAWHGIAYTELAIIAGARHVATALGLGNSFVFAIYFLTPLVIPLILHFTSRNGVWLVAAAAAGVAFVLFPEAHDVQTR